MIKLYMKKSEKRGKNKITALEKTKTKKIIKKKKREKRGGKIKLH